MVPCFDCSHWEVAFPTLPPFAKGATLPQGCYASPRVHSNLHLWSPLLRVNGFLVVPFFKGYPSAKVGCAIYFFGCFGVGPHADLNQVLCFLLCIFQSCHSIQNHLLQPVQLIVFTFGKVALYSFQSSTQSSQGCLFLLQGTLGQVPTLLDLFQVFFIVGCS